MGGRGYTDCLKVNDAIHISMHLSGKIKMNMAFTCAFSII